MNLFLLSHELLVLALGLGLLLVDLWLPPVAKRKLGYVAALGVGLILLYSLCCVRLAPEQPVQYAFGQMYVFDGLAGNLDHALASASLAPQVSAVNDWHINADEPHVLDYNEEYKSVNQLLELYNSDPYRASDHDPVLIDLNLVP